MQTWFIDNALYILVVIGTVFTFFWLWSFRDVLKLKTEVIAAISIAYSGLDAVCVKLFSVIEKFRLSAVNEMSLFGAIFFMPFAIWAIAKICKVKPLLLFDISVPGFLFMFICGRINCLITGCCYGLYMTQSLRWPVREGEIALYLVLLIIFGRRLKKGRFSGTLYPLFMIIYGIFRFAAEFVRWYPDQDGLWHRGHVCAVISFIAGIIWLWVIKKRTLSAA